jgi:hypothetical protein
MVVAVLLCLSSLTHAAKSDDLSKEANDLMRKAENAFFGGKFQESDTFWNQGVIQLKALKSEDPGHSSINALDTKYERPRTRIDEKLPKESPPSRKATSAPATANPVDAPKGLSSGALQNLENADKEMNYFEASLAEAWESLRENNFNMLGSRLYKAEDHLERAKELLGRVQRTYKIDSEHEQVKPLNHRHSELEKAPGSVKKGGDTRKAQVEAKKQESREKTAALDEEWFLRINDFIRLTGVHYIDYPVTHDSKKLRERNCYCNQGKSSLYC